jgi:hypothetical protein
MDSAHDEPSHTVAVDAWLALSIGNSSPDEIVCLFHTAFEALWSQAITALGSITLSAIAERVVHNATERYAFLSAINLRPNGNTRWKDQLHAHLALVPRTELIEGLRFGMIELLAVIGTLTAEILSEELHSALAATTTNKSASEAPAAPAAPSVDTKVLR